MCTDVVMQSRMISENKEAREFCVAGFSSAHNFTYLLNIFHVEYV